MERENVVRLLAAAETKSAGAEVIVAALDAHEAAVRAEALREASRWLLDHAEAVASGDARINPRVGAEANAP